ncbi:DUF4352 domain-containing protein [Ktedonosporobacter rubrisoli]|nr:DUF4352 domain-containing protein [Ktedonosporobacter rubrisoli]
MSASTTTDKTIASTANTTIGNQQTPSHHKIGETVASSGWQITVNKVSTSSGNDFLKPKDGHIFLEINVTMKNLTSETQTASSLAMWDLKSLPDGQKQNIGLGDTPGPEGKVEAGGALTGTLTYEVPTNIKQYTLSFTGSLLDNTLTIWNINL